MSLKNNIVAGYASDVYTTIIGILVVPVYLRYLGAEAYGLIGVYAMLLTWFNLLDLGLKPTMVRETARFRGGSLPVTQYLQFSRALHAIFIGVAILGGGALFVFSKDISTGWLNTEKLNIVDVTYAIQTMAFGSAFRWLSSLHRSTITGFEKLVWLSGFNIVAATFRSIGVLPVLWYFGATPNVFFTYQIIVALAELVFLLAKAKKLQPNLDDQSVPFSLAPLKRNLRFSLSLAFAASLWVIVTQTDKLILSKLLPLAEYGHFTLAVLAAGGVIMIYSPIAVAVTPRLTHLVAEGQSNKFIRLYHDLTQLLCVIVMSVSCTLAAFAEPLIWAWTGDTIAAEVAAPIMRLYALGNAVMLLGAFSNQLQYAKGDLQLLVVGSTLFVVILVPSLIWGVNNYGGVGGGYAWFLSSTIMFLFWTPLVHHRFVPGLHLSWMFKDVLPIVATSGLTAWMVHLHIFELENRLIVFLQILLMGGIVLTATAFISSSVRTRLKHLINAVFIRSRRQA